MQTRGIIVYYALLHKFKSSKIGNDSKNDNNRLCGGCSGHDMRNRWMHDACKAINGSDCSADRQDIGRGSNQVKRRLGLGIGVRDTEDDVVKWLNRIFNN